MRLGMRTIKTAVATVIAVIVSGFIGAESPFFMVIAAILTMQFTVADSFKNGKTRVLGTLLGAALGLLMTFILPRNPLGIGIGILAVIYVCNLLRWNQAIPIASVVFLSIIISEHESRMQIVQFSFSRILDTLVGIGIALAVNYFVAPPKLVERVSQDIHGLYQEFQNHLSQMPINNTKNFTALDSRLNDLKDHFDMLQSDARLLRTISISIEGTDNMMRISEDIRIHLKSLSFLSKERYVGDENTDLIKEQYEFVPFSQAKGLDAEEAVYRYHLQCILMLLEELKAQYRTTFNSEM